MLSRISITRCSIFPLKLMKIVKDSTDKGNSKMPGEKCIWHLPKKQDNFFDLDYGYLTEREIAVLVLIDPKKFHHIKEEVEMDAMEEFRNYERYK